MKSYTGVCPYKNLFILHAEGRLNEQDEKYLGKDFLGNWVEDEYSFLFFSSEPGDAVYKIIANNPRVDLLDKYSFTYEEWQGGGFEKKRIAEFIIASPWETGSEEDAGFKIILDPGVVFGNGLHPTTKDCLNAISYLKKQYSFKNVLDIGTGTGILAIASVHLGAELVTAVDLNSLAVKTAANNAILNGFEKKIKVYEGKAEDFTANDADLAIANIHFDVIRRLISKKDFLKRRYMIFSGLMRSQASEIKSMLLENKLTIENEWDHEMTWYTLLLRGLYGR